MLRSICVLFLGASAAIALHVELTTVFLDHRPLAEFPTTALFGTFATAVAIRLGLPMARRGASAELRTFVALFGVSTFSFVAARMGIFELYAAAGPRFPRSVAWVRVSAIIGLLAIGLALAISMFGWTKILERAASSMHRRAPFVFGAFMLAVIPSSGAIVAARGERTDLPNVVASGLTAFFTVVYAALATRLGAARSVTSSTGPSTTIERPRADGFGSRRSAGAGRAGAPRRPGETRAPSCACRRSSDRTRASCG